MPPLLSIRHLHIGFQTESGLAPGVEDIQLEVRRGEIVALVGESGSGKSITALSILQLLPVQTRVSGEIRLGGRDGKTRDLLRQTPDQMRKIRGGEIAMIFQEPMTSLNPVFTCGDQVMEAIRAHRGVNEREARQMAIALMNAKITPTVTRQQRLTLEMSIHNLKSTMTDKERVSKIQGLINHLMTYMSDSLALITGPYDDLLTLEDVLNQNLILYVSLNVNVNERAVTSLGRILLQNLQLTLGQRYAETGYGVNHPFVSVLMDEFAPFAYQNFSTILQTARGANVAFLFALQNYSQLVPAGFGLKESLSTGPNNTFMLRMKDDSSAYQFRREGGETKHERVSMQVERAGLLSPALEDRGRGSRSEVYETAIRDEQLKRLPSGQMQVLMTDQQVGLKHLHVHVRRPMAHFFMGDPDDAETATYPVNCLYPSMESPMWLTDGLNLRFPTGDLEEKRNDNLRRRGRRRAQ